MNEHVLRQAGPTRALVTGAGGFVGSRIVRRLLREGMAVRGLDVLPAEQSGAEPIIADVADAAAVQAAMAGVGLVVHCAAVIAGEEPAMMRVNVDGTRMMLDAATRTVPAPRFLYLSTAAVYDFDASSVVDETIPFRTDGPAFHRSRVAAEEAVWAASRAGLAVTVFRPHNILGAHPTATWSALLAQRMLKGDYAVAGDGSGSWPYVHVGNLADAVLLAVRKPQAIGQAYNIVDGQTTAGAYADHFRGWLRLPAVPTNPAVHPWCGRLSGDKAARDLGYAPRVSYQEAMAETERYLVDHGVIDRQH